MRDRGFAASGLVVAALGFGLSRFSVALGARETTAAFLFGGLVPLVLGLALAAGGVFLAIGSFERGFVRTVTAWCVAGTAAAGMLVVLTVLASGTALTEFEAIREQGPFSTFLIGGAVGGTLTGVYAGRNRRHRRDMRRRANRLVVLNRMLREYVVNDATVIQAHRDLLESDDAEHSTAVIGQRAESIVETVDEVKQLAETRDEPAGHVDLVACVESEVATARERYPAASFDIDGPERIYVQANERVRKAIRHLLENAVEHSDRETPRISVAVQAAETTATLRVVDDGPGLPADQQRLLERGEIAEYDDPGAGFGLNVVRLVADRFDATVRTDTGDGTTVELTFRRTTTEGRPMSTAGVSSDRAAIAVSASLVAGVAMAAVMAGLGGELLEIGELYGIDEFAVALLTHEFHSVAFGLVYVGLLAALGSTVSRDLSGRMALGVGLALALWLVASGFVMPLWLEFLEHGATVPNLTLASLVGHVVWGGTTALCYHAGEGLMTRSGLPAFGRSDPVD